MKEQTPSPEETSAKLNDTKKLLEKSFEDVRRHVDDSVPSSSISKELAEKIRDKYFPKKESTINRAVRVVKKSQTTAEGQLEGGSTGRTQASGDLKPVRLAEGSTVKEFAEKLGVTPKEVVGLLLQRGTFVTINQAIENDVAADLAKRFGYEVTFVSFEDVIEPPVEAIVKNTDSVLITMSREEFELLSDKTNQVLAQTAIVQEQIIKDQAEIDFLKTETREVLKRLRAA